MPCRITVMSAINAIACISDLDDDERGVSGEEGGSDWDANVSTLPCGSSPLFSNIWGTTAIAMRAIIRTITALPPVLYMAIVLPTADDAVDNVAAVPPDGDDDDDGVGDDDGDDGRDVVTIGAAEFGRTGRMPTAGVASLDSSASKILSFTTAKPKKSMLVTCASAASCAKIIIMATVSSLNVTAPPFWVVVAAPAAVAILLSAALLCRTRFLSSAIARATLSAAVSDTAVAVITASAADFSAATAAAESSLASCTTVATLTTS